MGKTARSPSELLLAAFVVSLLLTCKGYEELEPDDVCQETGFSIANRTLTCTDDTELGNARADSVYRIHPAIGMARCAGGF